MQISLIQPRPERKRGISQRKSEASTSINASQISLPQLKKVENRPWVYQDDYDYLKDMKNFFRLPDDNNSPYLNRKPQAIKLLQQVDLSDENDLEERFSFVLKYLKQAKFGNLYNITVLIYSYLLSRLNQFDKAIQVWLSYLVFCNGTRGFKYKVIAYKHLAELYLNSNQFAKSLTYSKKLLKFALYFGLKNYELSSYELIGKILYYMQHSDLAKAFHEKFLDGYCLGDRDPLRLQAVRMIDFQIKQRQKVGKIDTESDEEFELEKVVDPKPLMQNQMRLREVLINKRDLWGHVRKMSEPLGPMNGVVFDQRLFQREFYTQLSNNSSVKNFMVNKSLGLKKNRQSKILDKLIFDIQQF